MLTVGETTTTSLSLTGGGMLSSGPSIIGDQSGSNGSTVTVQGAGTLWQVIGGLTVGNADGGVQCNVFAKGAAVLDTLDVGAQSVGACV